MAFYKVLETSFIGHSLAQEGAVVDINDDPTNGGMAPGSNLAACDAEGNLTAAEGAKAPKAKSSKSKPSDEGEALA